MGVLDKLMGFTEEEGECWRWTGPESKGFLWIRMGERLYDARLLMWTASFDDHLPEKWTAVSNCGNPLCIQPGHLSLAHVVTRRRPLSYEFLPLSKVLAIKEALKSRGRHRDLQMALLEFPYCTYWKKRFGEIVMPPGSRDAATGRLLYGQVQP